MGGKSKFDCCRGKAGQPFLSLPSHATNDKFVILVQWNNKTKSHHCTMTQFERAEYFSNFSIASINYNILVYIAFYDFSNFGISK